MSRWRAMRALLLLSSLAVARPAFAQSAAVEGRAVDEQQAAIPGVLITLVRRDTGFARETTTDSQGAFRITGVPPGAYDIRASIDGFVTVEQRDTIVDVSAIVRANFTMRVASVRETVAVTAASPLVQAASATIGGVVDERRIQELPLNGRQFANLAATLPGVGVGFHRDPTKSSEYMPQVGGGNGRNVNYVVDGAENVDDTVGGPLQLYPLDAIDEFRFSIASYGAEHGRGSGGVLSVVTKSGANRLSGGGFTFGRNEALNARTTSEERGGLPKSDYRRWQYGGSIGGPIVANTAHFFAAAERVQQDTFQAVDLLGLLPSADGVFPIEYRENLFTAKVTVNAGTRDRIAVRDALNTNSQPQGVGPRIAEETWADSRNRFHSLNGSWGRVVGSHAFNELIVQWATFDNTVDQRTNRPLETFPNGVQFGHSTQAPQATEQRHWQLRDDVSVHTSSGFGMANDIKSGGTWTHEPRLGVPAATVPAGYINYGHLTNDRSGPISGVNGNPGTSAIAEQGLNTPLERFGVYMQDDWRATTRLTVNAGLRYDVVRGFQIDQSRNPNFLVVQQAAQAGRFRNVVGFEDFGQTPREDLNNVQPRLGFALDVNGNGSDVIRGGWGVFTDSAFTNNNILFAAFDARGPQPSVDFNASNPNGLTKPDGTFFRVGDPLVSIAALNEGGFLGLGGEVLSPRFEQPYTRQVSIGWSHQLGSVSSFTADYIRADGRDLSLRMRLNTRPNGGARRFADLLVSPNSLAFRPVTSDGKSQYDAVMLSVRRRTAAALDLAVNYTWSNAKALLGQAVDETGLGGNTILDAIDPFAAAEWGPSAADVRHRLSASAIVPIGWGVQVAPIFYFRSALPVATIEGIDRNGDFSNTDLPDQGYAFAGVGRTPQVIGTCAAINCGRGAGFTQMNVRLSKTFVLSGASKLDLIAEVFNLFDATNPGGFNPRRMLGVGNPNADFIQPTSFAGDFQQPEQRVGQIGVKLRFGK